MGFFFTQKPNLSHGFIISTNSNPKLVLDSFGGGGGEKKGGLCEKRKFPKPAVYDGKSNKKLI
jgi:hypothetical protein